MREFTPKEKELLKKFVSLKKRGQLDELQVATFLKVELDCFALKWQTTPKVQLSIYAKPNTLREEQKITQNYFRISDFIYFIKELCSYNFIEIQSFPTENKTESEDNSPMLFDRDKYEYNADSDEFWTKPENTEVLGSKYSMTALVGVKNKSIFYLDIVHVLNKYCGIIYPLPLLVDFVENNFKTIEQRQFEEELQTAKDTLEETKKSLKKTQWALFASWGSFVVALVALILTLIIPQEIDDKQINSITTAIKEQKTVTIDSVKALPADTFNVNVIQPKVKPAPKPKQEPLKQPLPNNWYVRTATNNGD